MRRFHLGLLAGALLSSLSCGVFPLAPLPDADDGLPHVSAPPPAGRADPKVAAIIAHLERRNTGLTRLEEHEVAHTLVAEARRRGIDPDLVMAVVHVESRFRNYAVSNVGALGLMQILPSTGRELAEREGILWRGTQTLFDPVVNVKLGIAYLEQLSARYDGDIGTALAAYNWGPGHIDGRLRRGTALPTQYPRLVFEAHAARSRS